VAVSAEKDDTILTDLLIVEIFFPDRSALQNRLPALKDAVREIGMKQ
jgi:hypothetical protein